MKAVIFARVSSTNGSQDYQRQITDLNDYARRNSIEIVAVFAEKISGAKLNTERVELQHMIEFVQSGKAERILVTEISRLGRNTHQVLSVLEELNRHKISLFILNYGIDTLTPLKEINPMSQFLITILAEVAAMERGTIRNRMASGYSNYRSKGGAVGRKVGYRITDDTLKAKYIEEIKLIKKGISLRNISKITGTSVNTIRKVARLIQPS